MIRVMLMTGRLVAVAVSRLVLPLDLVWMMIVGAKSGSNGIQTLRDQTFFLTL